MPVPFSTLKREFEDFYHEFSFEENPWWAGVLGKKFTKQQIVKGEVQHYLRTRTGRKFRVLMLASAAESPEAFDIAWPILEDEIVGKTTDGVRQSHYKLMLDFFRGSGITLKNLDKTDLTPCNAAAIAIYRDLASRSFVESLGGAGIVELFYPDLCKKVYKAYTGHYGFSHEQAFTYYEHQTADDDHSTRALEIIEKYAKTDEMQEKIRRAVKDAIQATHLHYAGMYEGAVGKRLYWNFKY